MEWVFKIFNFSRYVLVTAAATLAEKLIYMTHL